MSEINNIPNDLSGSQKGISNTTIAMLLILALVITVIGTWAVLNSMSSPVETPITHNTNVARVSFSIIPPESKITGDVAKVVLEINNK